LATRKLEAILADRNQISEAVRLEVQGPASQYGVVIVRADVKDLVFPGNLREIMNQVLETERRAEAKLIQAKTEAQRIKALADNEAAMMKVEAEKARATQIAELDRMRFEEKLARDVQQARAMREHPALLRLRELETFGQLAEGGAKLVVGVDGIFARASATDD